MSSSIARPGKRCGVVFCVLAVLGSSGAVSGETLVSTVAHALETNPELQSIRANRKAIDFELDAARGLYLPTVDVRGDLGRSESSRTSGIGIETSGPAHRRREVSGVVSQRIFDGFEARHEVARHRNRVESAKWRVSDTANSIALRAVQAYLEILRARAVLHAAKSNLTQLRSLQGRVAARVSGGKGTSSETAEAAARVAQAQALVAEAVNRIGDAEALYRAVVGKAPHGLSPPTPPRKALPGALDAAVAVAVSAAPSVLATQYDTTAAEAAVGIATSRLFPKLTAELSAEKGWGTSEANDKDYEARGMLVVRWNLFNGGIDKARIHEAKARSIEAAEISANTQRVIEREVRVSWNAMTAAGERVPALSRQLDANRRRRSTYLVQFDAGSRSLLDLLDAQNELFVTEASLETEKLVGAFNVYRVLAGMGRLVDALGLSVPDEGVVAPAESLPVSWRRNYYNWRTIIEFHRRERHEAQDTGTK